MTVRPILIHPDPRLRKEAEPVARVDAEARALVDDMFETMYDAPGIGLAAPQIGVLKRVFVIDCATRETEDEPATPEPMALINPVLDWVSEETSTYAEGCLSVPEQYEDVTRPARVRMRYLDADGAEQVVEFDGLRATCAQHELDHLNGKLFIDHIGPVRRQLITARMKKLKRERAKAKGA
ncbi:MAG: peptide deformylase [Pseudomonadota bacterium]